MKVSKEELRNFYVNYHGFGEFYDLDAKSAIVQVFDRIGSVQFDPLNVVGRNAELVLFARNKNFTRQSLYDALYKDNVLIDGWDKMMCIYPRKQFPCFAPVRERMLQDYNGVISWRKQTDCYDHIDDVYAFIEQNGPVLVTDIPSPRTNNGRWGPTKIAGVCCEYLWFGGKIVVAGKKGGIKMYDTSLKALGKLANEKVFDDLHSFLLWYVKRRIASVGALWNKNGGAWLGTFLEKTEYRTSILNELVERHEIVPIEVEGEKERFYICKGAEKYFNTTPTRRVVLVAPLDNFIWDRKLIQKVFDFDYTWEVYVPQHKRKYGYYVLPILIGNRFVGRIEPEQYKDGKPLNIKNIWYENGFAPSDDDIKLIAAELERLALFLGTELDASVEGKLKDRR